MPLCEPLRISLSALPRRGACGNRDRGRARGALSSHDSGSQEAGSQESGEGQCGDGVTTALRSSSLLAVEDLKVYFPIRKASSSA
jgi:hypothetical protein